MPRRQPPPATIDALFAAATQAWREFERTRPGYHTYVHADWRAVVPVLSALRARADTFLECGSGVGAITILADLLGFDAYGIELDPWLHARSLDLAAAHRSRATFALGSFVPASCRDDLGHDDGEFLTLRDGEPAYAELGMQLRDFDLVYAFPWPGEEERFLTMMARAGRRDAGLLLYGATDGYQLFVRGRPVPL